MVWIIIAVVLLVAFGPVLYLLPTKKDRRLAALRQRARLLGFVVELKAVRKLNPEARDRVTAGGRIQIPQHDSIAYGIGLAGRLRHVLPWRLLKGAGTPAPLQGWVLDEETTESHDLDYLAGLQTLFARLPDDTVAMELGTRTLTCYWLEAYPADEATIDELHEVMTEFGKLISDRDGHIGAELDDLNS